MRSLLTSWMDTMGGSGLWGFSPRLYSQLNVSGDSSNDITPASMSKSSKLKRLAGSWPCALWC
jgi:hypothetical protein